jgi:porphyrinogen peroxidase
MPTPQSGIFAVGTAAHVYLEFDIRPKVEPRRLVESLASLREPGTTMAGINLVTGFRPELWRSLMPTELPSDLRSFDQEIRGVDGFSMPATQHDAVLWLAGSANDLAFDAARQAIRAVEPLASVADETSGWAYHHDRDLTGFIDGTENPTLIDAPGIAIIPAGRPGAGGSVLLLQKWRHEVAKWESLSVTEQERAIGRTKSDSTELDPKPPGSHAARTDQDVFGDMFRRNMPYGSVADHGTVFVGFAVDQARLARMLDSMAGVTDGVRDALTLYTTPLTGAYYFVPPVEALREFEIES